MTCVNGLVIRNITQLLKKHKRYIAKKTNRNLKDKKMLGKLISFTVQIYTETYSSNENDS